MDLLQHPLKRLPFSPQPFSFLARHAREELAMISEIELVEFGPASSRESWQRAQLRNLVRHAMSLSPFWRKRLAAFAGKEDQLENFPPLGRSELGMQVDNEHSLIKPDGRIQVMAGQTSGSTGVPTRFYHTSANTTFNRARSTAQYLFEGRPLNRNKIMQSTLSQSEQRDVHIETFGSWLGPLETVFENGTLRTVKAKVNTGVDTIFKHCFTAPAGYWVSLPRIFETAILQGFTKEVLNLGIDMFIPRGEAVSEIVSDFFHSANIPIRSTYSTEELGLIGNECATYSSHYHVCTSNVIVEAVPLSPESEFKQILVTHLHSYATPLIRYEIGDVGDVAPHCRCGHSGPTVINLSGRKSALLKLANGTVRPFSIRAGHLAEVISLVEYRIRQTDINLIKAEIARPTPFSDEEVQRFSAFLSKIAGSEFKIEVTGVPHIEWGISPKRLGFRCEI